MIKQPEKRDCPICGQGFAPRKYNQKFCSQKCRWTHTNHKRILKPNQVFNCEVCGKRVERYVAPSDVRYSNRFCGYECKGTGQSGKSHWNWKGGRIVEPDGYVIIYTPDHPNANSKGYVFEHRLVMEAYIGRHLEPQEVVHHVNGNRADNAIENLELYANNSLHKKAEAAHIVRNEKGQITRRNHAA